MTKWMIMIFLPCRLLQHYHLLKSLVSQHRDLPARSVTSFDATSPCWVVAFNTPQAWTNAARQLVVSSLRRVSLDEC